MNAPRSYAEQLGTKIGNMIGFGHAMFGGALTATIERNEALADSSLESALAAVVTVLVYKGWTDSQISAAVTKAYNDAVGDMARWHAEFP